MIERSYRGFSGCGIGCDESGKERYRADSVYVLVQLSPANCSVLVGPDDTVLVAVVTSVPTVFR